MCVCVCVCCVCVCVRARIYTDMLHIYDMHMRKIYICSVIRMVSAECSKVKQGKALTKPLNIN